MLRYALPALLTFLSAQTAFAACSEEISRFQKLIDGDLKTGFIGKTVHATVKEELAGATKLCKAGQDAEATSAVRSIRVRHGYPAGSNQNLSQ